MLTMAPSAGAAPTAAETAAEKPAASTEAQRALADAKDSGERVEVADERSERTTVYANPDGYTFTLEESAIPVRVPKPGGGWQAPDPTLERNSDGAVAPKAAAVEMEFSAGGADSPWSGSRSAAGPWNWAGGALCPSRSWTGRARSTRTSWTTSTSR